MHSSLDPTLNQLSLLMPLLGTIDKDLANFLASIDGLEAHFCISQVLTWLSHTTDVWIVITRFFDLFLSTNPLMPIYVVAAILVVKKNEILCLDRKDFSIVHGTLSKFGASKSDMEEYIQIALGIFKNVPPDFLQRISGIYLGDFSAVNTFEDINSLFLKQTFNSKLGQKRIIQFSRPSSSRKILRFLIITTIVLIVSLNWKRTENQYSN